MNVVLMRWIDKYVCGVLIFVFSAFKKHSLTSRTTALLKHPKKILVIRLWALGSTLLTFPMIKQLQHHFGDDVAYDVLVTTRNKGIYKNQGYFSQIFNLFSAHDFFTLLFRKKHYDLVIDCEEYFRISALMALRLGKVSVGYDNIPVRKKAYTLCYHYSEQKHNITNTFWLLHIAGIPASVPNHMEPLVYHDKDKESVDAFLAPFQGKKIVCFHAGGAETSPDRFWADKNRVQLIDLLYSHYWNQIVVLLSGTKSEEETNKYIIAHTKGKSVTYNICGKFWLFSFAYLLSRCDYMVANDSGPMHLAAAMGTTTIGLFWPNLPTIFWPRPLDKHVGLYKGKGTVYIQPHLGVFKEDPHSRVNQITPEEVVAIIINE